MQISQRNEFTITKSLKIVKRKDIYVITPVVNFIISSVQVYASQPIRRKQMET